MIVTLDGPAGSGKSTIARQLAERLGFAFLDTGAMYRAVAAWCLHKNIPLDDPDAIADMAQTLELVVEDDRLIINQWDVTHQLRTLEVTTAASQVAVQPSVRDALVKLQREVAEGKDIVTEGRDQGTVVFPDAECKFFVTASPDERARRRLRELENNGDSVDFAEVLQQILERDERDATRKVAPLLPAPDAVVVDTTTMQPEEVLNQLTAIVRQHQTS